MARIRARRKINAFPELSPSPQPSPAGRGRIVFSLTEIRMTGFAGQSLQVLVISGALAGLIIGPITSCVGIHTMLQGNCVNQHWS